MEFRISNPDNDGIIVVKVTGEAGRADIFNLLFEGGRFLMKKKSFKVLVDIREEIGKFNLMDIVDIISNYPQFLRKYKIAVLDKKDNYEKIHTHQVMAYHRGFRMFGFTDYTEAVSWLNSGEDNDIPRRTIEYQL